MNIAYRFSRSFAYNDGHGPGSDNGLMGILVVTFFTIVEVTCYT
jgi:hypothetical protein